jgi:phospholipase A1
MKSILSISFFLLSLLGFAVDVSAQAKEVEELWKIQLDTGRTNLIKPVYLEISEEKILELFDKQPSFGMYHDNYFITGIPLNKEVNKHTADAKFQISIRQRLTKTVLPFNSFLMLTYTQKSFWDIYEKSSPFGDNNYNPGLVLAKPVVRNNKLRGITSFAFEHESNGKDSLDSRSWNYFTLSGVYFYNASLSVQAKVWYGWLDGENPDLFKYKGYGMIALNYRSLNDRFGVSLVLNPCKAAVNTQMEVTYRPNKKANQYLFLQWYQGYGESLLEYNRYTSMIRVGICMRPPMRNSY